MFSANRLTVVDLSSTLLGFENTLRLNINASIGDQIDMAIEELEREWSCSLEDRTILELREENPLAADLIDVFISRITECLKCMAYVLNTSAFYDQYGQTLRDVNYLGFDREKLQTSLYYLCHFRIYNNKSVFFDSLIEAASRLEVCEVRRLMAIMAVLDRLGYYEGVGVIAQYLYIGMKVH